MARSRSFWVKVAGGLAAIGLGLGLMLSGKLPVEQGINLILKGIESINQAPDHGTGELLQAPEPPPVDRRDEVVESGSERL